MVVLALETVTPAGSTAVVRDELSWVRAGTGAPHASRLPGDWIELLSEACVDLDAVDRLAVVSGPGSFTGVRIGMAAAQGLAVTRGWQVAMVPTLDAMAECWRASHAGLARRTVVACLDGMRGQVFAREFLFDGAAMVARGEPIVVSPELLRWQSGQDPVALVGSGAIRYADQWNGVDEVADLSEPIAAGAARLAARPEWAQVPPQALVPLYVRRPDVELARERRQGVAGRSQGTDGG